MRGPGATDTRGLSWASALTGERRELVAAAALEQLERLVASPGLASLEEPVFLPMEGWDRGWTLREQAAMGMLAIRGGHDCVLLVPAGLRLVESRKPGVLEDPLGRLVGALMREDVFVSESSMVLPSPELVGRFRFDPDKLRELADALAVGP